MLPNPHFNSTHHINETGEQELIYLQMVSVVSGMVRELGEAGDEESSDRELARAEGEPTTAQEQEPEGHVEGHVRAVSGIPMRGNSNTVYT